MQQSWRFLDTGVRDAASNMAIDEAILLTHEAGAAPPTLRVYAWDTPTLSLGYAQNAAKEVDLTACRQHGVGVIRRPTGGRAVLHDREVTYSVVLPTTSSQEPTTLTEHYRRIGLALTAALQQLGLAVHFERAGRRRSSPRIPSSAACFSALARYEISAAGRKIIGSAQKRTRKSLLQHGAIPLEINRTRLFQCLQTPLGHQAALVQEAYSTMTAVNEIAPAPIAIPTLHQALQEAFADSFGITMIQNPLELVEERLATELRTSKYATSVWNLEGAAAWRRNLADTAASKYL